MGDSSYVTYCRLCNAKVPANSSFCTECGQNLMDSSGSDLTCASCGENLSDEYRFCPECGEKIKSIGTCPQCTARIPPGTRFCTECGYDLGEYQPSPDEDKPTEDPDKTGFLKGLGGFRDKAKSSPEKSTQINMERYLVCDTCRGYYQLQEGEEPDDFSDECECGGKLECRDSKE